MGNQELHDYFICYVAFNDVCHSYGLPHHLNISLLVIESTIVGYMEAFLLCVQLSNKLVELCGNTIPFTFIMGKLWLSMVIIMNFTLYKNDND
ncbi:hypothetical protein H5410_062505 [Solanum commersonii]|uniref:Uncharacterized protein n=1 Tax=Solanum commersonii TaxID=4109 RepID=A0A9J5WAJ7_SOLCO|nr:hypothetical protein H5410_062505 [Solanum commersonii]